MFFILGPIIVSAIRIPMMLSAPATPYFVGSLVGWIVGSLVSIVIGIVILRRGPIQPPQKAPEETAAAAVRYKRWSRTAYKFGIGAFVLAACGMAAIVLITIPPKVQVPLFLVPFTAGLLAIFLGKGLDDASKKA